MAKTLKKFCFLVVFASTIFSFNTQAQETPVCRVLSTTMVTDDDGYPSGSGVRMVWTGEEYGLIWKEARGDFYGSYHTDVLFARVDADGNRIGSVKQVFTSQSVDGRYTERFRNPSIAWNGSEYCATAEHDEYYDRNHFLSHGAFVGLNREGDVLSTPVTFTDYFDLGNIHRVGNRCAIIWRWPDRESHYSFYLNKSEVGGHLNPENKVEIFRSANLFDSDFVSLYEGNRFHLLIGDHIPATLRPLTYLKTDQNGRLLSTLLNVHFPQHEEPSSYNDATFTFENNILHLVMPGNFFISLNQDGEVTERNTGLQLTVPKVAWTGEDYGLFGMQQQPSLDGAYPLLFAKIDATGALIQRSEIIVFGNNDPRRSQAGHSDIAWNEQRNEFATVWSRYSTGIISSSEIFFTRIGCVSNHLECRNNACVQIQGEGTDACHTIVDCQPICGNGRVEGEEQCDLGLQNSATGACTVKCKTSRCGDGFIQKGEECDREGQNSDTSACTTQCKNSRCGDGFVLRGGLFSQAEECDLGPQNSNTGACTTQCKNPRCGDGFVQRGEQCDDGNARNNDGCSSTCRITPVCGNGRVEEGEECDDGNARNSDGCSSICLIERPPQTHSACVDGTCSQVVGAGANTCNTNQDCQGQHTTSCTETDGGWRPYVSGSVTLSQDNIQSTYTDRCCTRNPNIHYLKEFFCNTRNGTMQNRWYACKTCQQGACTSRDARIVTRDEVPDLCLINEIIQ